MQEAKELLQRVYTRLEDPSRWCQMSLAMDSKGYSVSVHAPEACKWCIAGALAADRGEGDPIASYSHYNRATFHLNTVMDGNLIGYNDSYSHTEVLAKLRVAIDTFPATITPPYGD